MKEPIFLMPVFKDYIWGGNKLNTLFGKKSPYEITAESWEISTNPDGISYVEQGEFKGLNLEEIFNIKERREEIFGVKAKNLDKFPLLIKFIDANSNLSVQVHPDNKYAYEKENKQQGKTEMWYVMECKEGAQIICGLKDGIKQEEVKNILNSNHIADSLNFVNVKQGDCIYIPSGTIHAILGDTLICEVQQNSNLTYRVYDWDRVGKDGKPRELHIEKAIDVVKVGNKSNIKNTNNLKGENNIINSEFFKTNKIAVQDTICDKSDENTFYAFNVVKGNGKLKVENREYNLNLGDSFIIPASLGKYEIMGNIELLKSFI